MTDSQEWYSLEAVDAWFFRDGRPANRGEFQGVLDSLFPPNASTVVGALRAALARTQGWDGNESWDASLNPILGNGPDDLGALTFTGPFLQLNGQWLFAMPRHVVGHVSYPAGKAIFDPVYFAVPSKEPYETDSGSMHLPAPPAFTPSPDRPKPPEETGDFFVTKQGLEKILAGDLPDPSECIHRDRVFKVEERIGIARNGSTWAVEEGHIYHPRFIRLQQGASLAMGIGGLPAGWEAPGLLPLGGESRLAACKKIASGPNFPNTPALNGKAVVIALTPVRFDGDCWWGAGPGDAASKLSTGLGGTVTTVAIDRPLGIGGWDTSEGRSLPVRPYARAASVWWVENVTNGTPELRLGQGAAFGYGHVVLGNWPRD